MMPALPLPWMRSWSWCCAECRPILEDMEADRLINSDTVEREVLPLMNA